MDDLMQLGGNIKLFGFRDIDGASMVVLKKIIGNHVKHMTELTDKFENLEVTMKSVYKSEESRKYEISTQLINDGKPFVSEVIEKNLFVAVDNALKKIINEIS